MFAMLLATLYPVSPKDLLPEAILTARTVGRRVPWLAVVDRSWPATDDHFGNATSRSTQATVIDDPAYLRLIRLVNPTDPRSGNASDP